MKRRHMSPPAKLRRGLVQVRWATRLTLLLGVAASGAANVLHAEPNVISRTISAWPPLALLLTVELISRVPVHRRWLAISRMVAMSIIALVAFGISYFHMGKVAEHYGETPTAAWLLPLTVDGLVVVASVSLIELNARIGVLDGPDQTAATPVVSSPVPAAPATVHAALEPFVPHQDITSAAPGVVNGQRTVPLIGMVTR